MHKVILVTGAAQRLGAQIAQTLHAAGYRVVIHHHHSQRAAQALVAQLNQQRANTALALRADLGDASAIAPLVAAAAAHWGRLDGLVNNAAVFRATPEPCSCTALRRSPRALVGNAAPAHLHHA